MNLLEYIWKQYNYKWLLPFRKLKFYMMGSKVGKVKIYGKVKIGGWYHNITIEDNVTLNEGVYLQARKKIIIKKNSRISSFVKIYTAKFTVESPRKHISKPVVIEENVWIGSDAIILPGVRI